MSSTNRCRATAIGAAISGEDACLSLLFEAGTDVNIANNHGSTPCNGAANGEDACLSLLIKAGVDVNIANINVLHRLRSKAKRVTAVAPADRGRR